MTTKTYVSPSAAATSPFLSIGNSGSYTSRIMLRWLNFPVSIGDSGTIKRAFIRLYSSPYGMGNSSSISFTAAELKMPWSSYTFTSDSLSKTITGITAGTFSGPVSDSIEFDIDTTLVRSWMRLMRDGNFTQIFGLALIPGPSSTGIRAFYAFENFSRQPQLFIDMDLGGKDSVVTPTALEDTYIATGPAPDPNGLAVHGGISWRSRLRVDVSSIPPGSIVNNVQLVLNADSTQSLRMYRAIDTLIVYNVTDSTTNTFGTNSIYTQVGQKGQYLAQGLPLVKTVQQWVNAPSTNQGFGFVKAAEVSDLDKIVFYGTDADVGKRPRLIVTWTKKP